MGDQAARLYRIGVGRREDRGCASGFQWPLAFGRAAPVMSPPCTNPRLVSGSVHLHRLGPRATAEFIFEIAVRYGAEREVLDLLDDYRLRLTVDMLRQVGGDKFPPRPLHPAPDARQ